MDGNCPGWELTGGNCPGWEMSGMGTVRDGNCPDTYDGIPDAILKVISSSMVHSYS